MRKEFVFVNINNKSTIEVISKDLLTAMKQLTMQGIKLADYKVIK